jgi:hypothetical protein
VAEVDGVGAGPADQDIGGARALERIVARAAVEGAVAEDVAHQDVVAAAAVEEVIAAAALNDVVAVLAVKLVGAGGPGEGVVEIRAEHVLDADERVAFGRAADPAPGRQIDTDARRRVAVEHRVDAGAAASTGTAAVSSCNGAIAASSVSDRARAAGAARLGSVQRYGYRCRRDVMAVAKTRFSPDAGLGSFLLSEGRSAGYSNASLSDEPTPSTSYFLHCGTTPR